MVLSEQMNLALRNPTWYLYFLLNETSTDKHKKVEKVQSSVRDKKLLFTNRVEYAREKYTTF